MRKLIVLVLLMAGTAGAALNLMTWDGSASSDFNDTANWTGTCASGSTLSPGDSCLQNTGAVAATVSGNVSIGYLMQTATYTGAFGDGGYTVTLVNGANLGATSLKTCSGAWTVTADGNVTFPNVGTYSVASMTIDMQGTGNYQSTPNLLSGKFAYTGKIDSAISTPNYFTSAFNINGGKLCIKASGQIGMLCGYTGVLTIAANSVIVNNGTFKFYHQTTGSGKTTFPKIISTGTGIIVFDYGTGSGTASMDTFNLNGIIAPGQALWTYQEEGARSAVFIHNDSIVCTQLIMGKTAVGAGYSYHYFPPIVKIGTTGITSAGYNTDTSYVFLLASAIYDTGVLTWGSNTIVNQGTSVFNVVGATGRSITVAGEPFYRVNINISGIGTITLADVFNATDSLVLTDGKLSAGDTVKAAHLKINTTDSALFAKPVVVSTTLNIASAAVPRFWFPIYGVNGTTLSVTSTAHILPRIYAKNLTAADSLRANRWMISDSGSWTFPAGKRSRCDSVTAGDYEGIVGKRTQLQSGTPGSRAYLYLPAQDTVGYVSFTDCSLSVIISCDSTCRTDGNNRNLKTLSYYPASTFSVSPAASNAGDTITITCNGGFTPDTNVITVGGIVCKSWRVDYKNLKAILPAMSGGHKQIVVTNSDTDAVTMSAGIWYLPAFRNIWNFKFGFQF